MKLLTIIAFMFILTSVSPCNSDTLTSYVDENGKTVWTNSGHGNKERAHNELEQEVKATTYAINMRHPEIASNDELLTYFIKWRDHFVRQGQPLHTAMLLAEQQMINQGEISNAPPIHKGTRNTNSQPIPLNSRATSEVINGDKVTLVKAMSDGLTYYVRTPMGLEIWKDRDLYYFAGVEERCTVLKSFGSEVLLYVPIMDAKYWFTVNKINVTR